MNNLIFLIIIRYMLVLIFLKKLIINTGPLSLEIAYNAIVVFYKKYNIESLNRLFIMQKILF